MILEEYVVKEKKKIHKYIIDDVEIFSHSDKETLLQEIHVEKNLDKVEN